MPDKVAIHLPSMLTRKSVYERMKQERVDCDSPVSQSQFYSLWSQHYPHVTIPAVSIIILCLSMCIIVYYNYNYYFGCFL